MHAREIEALLNDLRKVAQGPAVPGEPLARHTSLRVGGPADVFLSPWNLEDLHVGVRYLRRLGVPHLVIGRGTNLLVRDGGVEGVVVRVGRSCREIRVMGERVYAGAGTSMAQLALSAAAHGLAGLEFSPGIPGSVGGALTMNAGAHGGSVADVLHSAVLIDPDGERVEVPAACLHLSYRTSRILLERQAVVLAGVFALIPDDPVRIQERMEANLSYRNATQPLQWPSAGSVFRNPPGSFAARLIEQAGLKGFRVGDAQISEIHANFIVNRGNAKAADALALIDAVQERIRAEYGVELELEVQVVGRS